MPLNHLSSSWLVYCCLISSILKLIVDLNAYDEVLATYSHTFTPSDHESSAPNPDRTVLYHRICHQYRRDGSITYGCTIYNFVSFYSIDGRELSFDQLAHGTTPSGVT